MTDTHDYAGPFADAPAHALIPVFTEPDLTPAPAAAPQLSGIAAAVAALPEGEVRPAIPAAPEVDSHPAPAAPERDPGEDCCDGCAAGLACDKQPAGPVPMLEGSFAIYVTPDQAVVLAYRPKGAKEDKQLLVPSFIIGMAAQQTGHTPTELLQQLGASL